MLAVDQKEQTKIKHGQLKFSICGNSAMDGDKKMTAHQPSHRHFQLTADRLDCFQQHSQVQSNST